MPIRYADSFDVLTHDDFKAWMGDTLAPAPMVCRLKEGTFTIDGFHDRFQACCNTNTKRSVSGLHFDNHKHGDVVATVTLSGRAIVTLERTAPDAPPARFEQCAWDFLICSTELACPTVNTLLYAPTGAASPCDSCWLE